MEDTMIAILLMLNNLLHDFAVAGLFATLLVLWYVFREVRKDPQQRAVFARKLARMLNRVVVGCWIVIILGGIVRTIAYEKFEWKEAAGRGQVAALVVKHILLVSLIVWGTVIQVRLRRLLREIPS